jgi:hypothetical protein
MTRTPLFDVPHKALRYAFSALLNRAATTDFSNLEDLEALNRQMSEVFELVKSHSHHEDDFCFEALDRIAPNATQHDRMEHIRLHHSLDDLQVHARNLIANVRMGQDEQLAGTGLYTALCELHAEMLQHMMEEERDTQPIFWQYMSDAEIMAFEPQIMAAMSPEMSALWLRYIVASQPMPKLTTMFQGIALHAPDFVLAANLSIAESVLPPQQYLRLKTSIHTKAA